MWSNSIKVLNPYEATIKALKKEREYTTLVAKLWHSLFGAVLQR